MNSQAVADYRHHDEDLEALLIAHALARPLCLPEVLEHVRPEDFASDLWGLVLETAALIREEGFTVSPALVKARLSGETIRALEGDDGAFTALAFLENLARTATPNTKAVELAKHISELALRRRLDAELESARARLADYNRPVLDCVGGVIEATGEASMMAAKRKGFLPTAEAADAMMRQLEDAMAGKPVPAIRTGLNRLDAVTGGFQAGDLVIVAGRPGMGKSLLLSAICRAAAQAGSPALIEELEMTRLQLLQRLATDLDYDRKNASQRSIPYQRLRAGKVDDAEFQRVYAASQAIAALPLTVYDAPGQTIHEIAARAERHAARSKTMGIVAIDYAQIIKPTNRYAGNKVQEITEISGGAKALAKRIGWPVVLGSQLSRAVEARQEKRPTLADLRESGAIEQDADIVLGLFRAAYYVEQKRPANGRFDAGWNAWATEWRSVASDLEISVLKNRNGPPTVLNVHIDITSGAIRNRPDDAGGDALPDGFYPEGYAG